MTTFLPKIVNHWVHSHEEDKEGIMVFRPSDYSFRPSRGRRSLQIKENGEIIIYDIGRDDRKTQENNTYELNDPNIIKIISKDSIETKITNFEIVECNDDVLKIRRI